MPISDAEDAPAADESPPTPADGFLIASLVGGDGAALRKLMDRYDRLVRYTIFRASKDRCVRDPLWLDSVASATWAGFVRSVQAGPASQPKSVRAYLAQIARNQVATALRKSEPYHESLQPSHDDDEIAQFAVQLEEPVEELARLELLETLQSCLGRLGADDRTLAAQLPAITERRWKEAADALGLKESTLRSRWKRILGLLRKCVEGKIGKTVAPGEENNDL